MNLSEIKRTVDAGKTVHFGNTGYKVIKDSLGRYLVTCTWNGYTVGLTHLDGVTMNGKPEQFFTVDQSPESLCGCADCRLEELSKK